MSDAIHDRSASRVSTKDTSLRGILIGAGVVMTLCLLSRVMNEELGHDEHIYVAAATWLDQYALYREISYGHLPNLPILLNLVLETTAGGYPLLTARFLIFVVWGALLLALASLAWRLSKSMMITGLAVLLIVTNPVFIGHSGTSVSANLFPVCLATFAFLVFVAAMEYDRARPLYIFFCGLLLSLAIGFKANYIIVVPPFVIAAFLLPSSLKLGERITRMALPMAAGGIIGGLPTLYYMVAHTDVFFFDVLEFFVGPHRSYWSEPANAATVSGLTLAGRIVYGYLLWSTGATVLIVIGILYSLIVFATSGDRTTLRRLGTYPVLIALALTILGVLISFTIQPSFPQYFMPPIPFAVVLLVCLLAAMPAKQRKRAQPMILTLAAACLVFGFPKLAQDLPKLASPSQWTGIKVHQTGLRIRDHLRRDNNTARLATLAPIYAAEANLDVYPELASGPFYYRIGDYLTAGERNAYGVTSPSTVHELFEDRPPDAILVGHEGELDDPLIDYAKRNEYVEVEEYIGEDRYGESVLYVAPSMSRNSE